MQVVAVAGVVVEVLPPSIIILGNLGKWCHELPVEAMGGHSSQDVCHVTMPIVPRHHRDITSCWRVETLAGA